MVWSSARVRLPSSNSTARACLLLVTGLLFVTRAHAQVEQAAAALGIGDTHGSVSVS